MRLHEIVGREDTDATFPGYGNHPFIACYQPEVIGLRDGNVYVVAGLDVWNIGRNEIAMRDSRPKRRRIQSLDACVEGGVVDRTMSAMSH